MVLIYCKSITNRLKYACEIVFKTILLTEYKITEDVNLFQSHNGPKISYGNGLNVSADLHIEAVKLLFENTITKQSYDSIDVLDYKAIFPVTNGDLPYDIFANAFYLVSRYEEYLPTVLDNHKRYKPESSVAFQKNFLKLPVVNMMALHLKDLILAKHPEYYFKPIPYTFVPGIDIDNAFAYKHKGFLRSFVSFSNLLVKFKFKKFMNRAKVVLGFAPDPYDSYDKQNSLHDQYNVRAKYFFLLGDYNSFDKNINYRNKYLQAIIKKVSLKHDVGIHPSYHANYYDKRVNKEIDRLKGILGVNQITESRQHYLRLKFPETYQNLIACGIKHDYTMGYSTQLGFRASICTPFPFYDINKETQTELIVHPFVAMDATFKYFLKIRASEVVYHIKPLYEIVKKVGGEMGVVFHNESIGSHKNWKNWHSTYENLLRMCVK